MKNIINNVDIEREFDYTHGNPTNRLGKFFNNITYSNGKIKIQYAYLGFLAAATFAYLISFSGIGLYGQIIEHYASKKSVISCKYKDPNLPFPSTLYGFDLDKNGSIDKITEIYPRGGLIKIPHKYSLEDKRFQELSQILGEK